MDSKNCVFCYRDVPDFERNNCNKDDVSVNNAEAEEFAILKSHMSVILLLRKFLDIPQEMCMNFLQHHGDPSSWIYSCEFCKTLVEKTENTYKQLVLINKKFEILKTEFKNAILVSASSEYILPNRNGSTFGMGTGPTEKVRSYIFEQHSKGEENFDSVTNEIKIERPDFEDRELNSLLPNGQYQHSMEESNLPIPMNYIIPDVIKAENENVHVPFDRNSLKAKRKIHKSGIKSIKCKKNDKNFVKTKETVIVGSAPTFKFRMKTVVRGKVVVQGPSSSILDYCTGCGKFEPNMKARSRCYEKDRGPYKCTFCPKKYGRKDILKQHVKDMHTPD